MLFRSWVKDMITLKKRLPNIIIDAAGDIFKAGCCTPNLAVDIFLDSKCSRVEAIQKMIRLGFSAIELNEGGFNSRFFQKELQSQGSAILLSECGYGHEALLALGYSNRLLQRSGLLP